MATALVLQHGSLGPPGLLGEWLDERGFDREVHHVEEGAALPDPRRFAFVASLGSAKSPRQREDLEVARELELLRACVAGDVPVLGLCFGGQALAAVLGGPTRVLDAPELGWQRVQTSAPDVVPEGPWLQWHYEAFELPPGAEELARSATGPQAFRYGPHLGTQFHPESTVEIVERWARHADPRRPGRTEDHVRALHEGHARHGADAAAAARRLFDHFWTRADMLSTYRRRARA